MFISMSILFLLEVAVLAAFWEMVLVLLKKEVGDKSAPSLQIYVP